MIDRDEVTVQNYIRRERSFSLAVPRMLKLIGLKNFVWLIALGIVLTVLQTKGTPHILFEYQYIGSKENKTSCGYVGLHPQIRPASQGHCSVLVLLKASD
ncbi:MAG: hypothetical protein AAF950_18425 [Pseudomonadota bacterium]